MKWEIVNAAPKNNPGRLQELLDDGWKPFAVEAESVEYDIRLCLPRQAKDEDDSFLLH